MDRSGSGTLSPESFHQKDNVPAFLAYNPKFGRLGQGSIHTEEEGIRRNRQGSSP
jgi:hypothetical protein